MCLTGRWHCWVPWHPPTISQCRSDNNKWMLITSPRASYCPAFFSPFRDDAVLFFFFFLFFFHAMISCAIRAILSPASLFAAGCKELANMPDRFLGMKTPTTTWGKLHSFIFPLESAEIAGSDVCVSVAPSWGVASLWKEENQRLFSSARQFAHWPWESRNVAIETEEEPMKLFRAIERSFVNV